MTPKYPRSFFFFFNDPATTEIYTLSLHDALPICGLPVVLYGHSMGGLIALGYVLADPPRPAPDLLVLSAPAIAAIVARWKRALADVLGYVTPRLEVPNDLPAGGLSRDPQ